jgi:hypothetical protein
MNCGYPQNVRESMGDAWNSGGEWEQILKFRNWKFPSRALIFLVDPDSNAESRPPCYPKSGGKLAKFS